MSTPTSIGYGSGYRMAYYNSGKMTNKGWEFRANIIALKRKDFQLGFNFNINQNTNKITEIPVNYTEENYTFGNGNYAFRYEVDRPLGSFTVIATKVFTRMRKQLMHVMQRATL